MLRHYLDILAHYSRAILVAAILLPFLLVAGNLALDRAELVTARVWIPEQAFLLDARMNGRTTSGAVLQARLMQELVSTDAFADEVLSGAGVGASREQRAEFRNRLQILAEGDQLLSVSYRSERAVEGVKVLNSLMTTYGTSTVLIQLRNAQRRSPVSAVDMRAARAAVDRYFAQGDTVGRSGGTTGSARQAPQSPQTALTITGSKADQYRRGLSGFLPLAAGNQDLAALEPAAYQLIDRPAIQHRSPMRFALLFLEALAGVVAGALFLAYVLAASGRTASRPPRRQPTSTAIRNDESPRS